MVVQHPRVVVAESVAKVGDVLLEIVPTLLRKPGLHRIAALQEGDDVDLVVGFEVARGQRLEPVVVDLGLGPQHGHVEVVVTRLGVVLGAEVVVGHVVQVDEGAGAVEREEVGVDGDGEGRDDGEESQEAPPPAQGADAQMAPQEQQCHARCQEEVDPLDVEEVDALERQAQDDGHGQRGASCPAHRPALPEIEAVGQVERREDEQHEDGDELVAHGRGRILSANGS